MNIEDIRNNLKRLDDDIIKTLASEDLKDVEEEVLPILIDEIVKRNLPIDFLESIKDEIVKRNLPIDFLNSINDVNLKQQLIKQKNELVNLEKKRIIELEKIVSSVNQGQIKIPNKLDKLKELGELLKSGDITKKEFENLKRKIADENISVYSESSGENKKYPFLRITSAMCFIFGILMILSTIYFLFNLELFFMIYGLDINLYPLGVQVFAVLFFGFFTTTLLFSISEAIKAIIAIESNTRLKDQNK